MAELADEELGISAHNRDRLHILTVAEIFEANGRANPDVRRGWAPVFDGQVFAWLKSLEEYQLFCMNK